MLFLIEWLAYALQWVFNMLMVLPLHLWTILLGGLQLAINAIPVPSFFAQAGNYVGNLPPMVAYLSGALQIPYGIAVMTTAMVARFILRRIPLIGG